MLSEWAFSVALCLASLAAMPAASQELVPNGGFETFTTCPNGPAQIQFAAFWYSPSEGTPEYYNACSVNLGVPDNVTGTQPAHGGVAHAALVATNVPHGYFEYVQTPLSAPLQAGKTYTVSFWVSRADGSGIAIDRLGAYLSLGAGGRLHERTPRLRAAGGQHLGRDHGIRRLGSDQRLLRGAGDEDHITIGNFEPPQAASQTVTRDPPPVFVASIYAELEKLAYYYVDDVSVTEDESSGCCDADLNDDGVVNNLDLTFLSACLNLCPPTPGCIVADIDCDGCVDVGDFQILACQFGGAPDPECCAPPELAPLGAGRFCVSGSSTGAGWRWQLDAEPPVTVPGLSPGAGASELSAAFATRITDDGPPGANAVSDPLQPACLQAAYELGFELSVGPVSGSIDCTVTGNPSGCSFNPTLTDASFLPPYPGSSHLGPPPQVPSLGTLCRALLLVSLGLAGIRSRIRA